jgi:hypothetical protein
MLLRDLPPWEVAYIYFSQWQDMGVHAHQWCAAQASGDEELTGAIIDSQAAKRQKKGLAPLLAMMLPRKTNVRYK